MLARLGRSKLAVSAVAGIGAVVLLSGVALASGVMAPPSPVGGISADVNADVGRLASILNKLIQQGVITKDQADKIVAAVRAAAGTALPAAIKRDLVAEAANAIGIAPADLRQELPGKTLAMVAQAHGVSRDALVQMLVATVDADADKAVADKKITSEQADRLKKNAPDAIAKAVDRVVPQPKTAGPRVKAIANDLISGAAKAIGIPTDQLKRELPGKSVVQVAQAHNVSRDTLTGALTKDAIDRIDAAVSAAKITADQASRMRALVPAAVVKFVDRVH